MWQRNGIDLIKWKNHSPFFHIHANQYMTIGSFVFGICVMMKMVERAVEACLPSFLRLVCDSHCTVGGYRGHRVRRQHWSIDPISHKYHLLTSSLVGLHCFRFVHVYSFHISFTIFFAAAAVVVVVILNIAGIWFCIRLLIFKMNYLDCFDWTGLDCALTISYASIIELLPRH